MENQIQTITFNMLPMTIGVLPSSYVDSMSYYETLLWLCNYLENTVIPTVNNNGEAVEELQSAFLTLQDYIDHYFDNLDVQTEINNKLDQMAEDGTLTNLIKAYVDPIYTTFENQVNDEITTFKNSVTSEINTLNERVSSSSSGSPKGVYATVSALEAADPDHDYIYVVTADGKWYYYNTDSSIWSAGGTYQATSIANGSIDKYKLDNELQSAVYKQVGSPNLFARNYDIVKLYPQSTDVLLAGDNYRTIVVECEHNKTYFVSKLNTQVPRLTIASCTDYPVSGGTTNQHIYDNHLDGADNSRYSYITTGNTDNYILLFFYQVGDTDDYTTVLKSLKCYDTTNFNYSYSYPDYNNDNIANTNFSFNSAITNSLGSINIFNPFNMNQFNSLASNATGYITDSGISSFILPLKNNTSYTITRKTVGPRFGYTLCSTYPFPYLTEHSGSVVWNNTGTTLTFSNVSYKYAVIRFYHAGNESRTWQEAAKEIKVYETDTVVEPSYVFGNLLDPKYIQLVKNRPLGPLEKGYIAISADDGNSALASVTIPLFLGYKATYNKNIPLTMGLMESSDIFDDASSLSTVLGFINSTNSSVAIHGTTSFTSYTQNELFTYLDETEDYLTENLVAPTSIIYPNHDYDTLSSTICGTYYGICATGGNNTPITYNGDSKLAGPRSNMYTIYRFSLFNAQMTNQKIKDAIDYAYDHHMIFTPFFHDHDLVTDYDRCKALLDYCVSYANSKGLTFINLGDIPYIK